MSARRKAAATAEPPPAPAEPESTSLRNLWRFMGFSLPYWPSLSAGLVTGLVRMLLPLFMPYYVKYVIDEVGKPLVDGAIDTPAAWSRLGAISLLLGGMMVVHWAATLGRFYWPHRAAASAIRDVRFLLFRHLQRLSLGFHQKRPTGGLVARVISDVESAQHIFDIVLVQLSQHILRAVVILSILFYIDWMWALVALATTPLFLITTRLLRRPMRRVTRQQRETVERISGHVQERFSMIKEVQAFTAEVQEERQVLDTAEQLRRYTLRQRLFAGFLHAASEITRLLGLAVVLAFGIYRITQGGGRATIGALPMFYMYTQQVLQPMSFFADLYTQMQVAAAAADRVFDFFDTEPDIASPSRAERLVLHHAPTVTFENVSFAYPTADNPAVVLREIDFSVAPGSKVVLVGESGTGKSTLLSLLPRFYDPQKGRVLLDNIDIKTVDLRSLRQKVAVVPQEPVLFTGTIRENILYGRPKANEDDIREAARSANAEQFILQMEHGYETVVGERGVGLSGGQIQRVAIARAFLKDPAVLIMDEPTSALDATSEMLVMQAIDRLAEGRTTFMIAHRLSVARDADLIIALQGSRIAEMGTHDELITAGGVYAELWHRQAGMA